MENRSARPGRAALWLERCARIGGARADAIDQRKKGQRKKGPSHAETRCTPRTRSYTRVGVAW
jgi:hypothetical protein